MIRSMHSYRLRYELLGGEQLSLKNRSELKNSHFLFILYLRCKIKGVLYFGKIKPTLCYRDSIKDVTLSIAAS